MSWEALPNGSICEAKRACGCLIVVRPAAGLPGGVTLHHLACGGWHTQAGARARGRILAGEGAEPQDLLRSYMALLDEENRKPYVKPPLHRDPIFVICHREADLPDEIRVYRAKPCCDCKQPLAVLLQGLIAICVRPVLLICQPCSVERTRACGGRLSWTYNVKPRQ